MAKYKFTKIIEADSIDIAFEIIPDLIDCFDVEELREAGEMKTRVDDSVEQAAFIRNELLQHLGNMMSEVSESSYGAGWMHGCEDAIPQAVRERLSHKDVSSKYLILYAEAERMQKLADHLGCWATCNPEGNDYDGTKYIEYHPKHGD